MNCIPEEADKRQLHENLNLLKLALDSGKLSADRYTKAVEALNRAYMGLSRDFVGVAAGDDPLQFPSITTGEQSLEDLNKTILDRLPESLSKLASHAEATKVQVVKSFKDMADDTLSALNRLSSAIQGGGFSGHSSRCHRSRIAAREHRGFRSKDSGQHQQCPRQRKWHKLLGRRPVMGSANAGLNWSTYRAAPA